MRHFFVQCIIIYVSYTASSAMDEADLVGGKQTGNTRQETWNSAEAQTSHGDNVLARWNCHRLEFSQSHHA